MQARKTREVQQEGKKTNNTIDYYTNSTDKNKPPALLMTARWADITDLPGQPIGRHLPVLSLAEGSEAYDFV